MKTIRYDLVPVPYMRPGVERWIEKGIRPGDFLMAVIENDFVSAVAYADRFNRANLKEWMDWFMEHAPGACWGSVAKAKNWKGLNNETD